LKSIPKENLDDELIDITNRLHNTALQRVDRFSFAFGVLAYLPFLDSEVVEFALQIPAEYKINNGTEKWILRQSLKGILPKIVFNRKMQNMQIKKFLIMILIKKKNLKMAGF